MTKEQLIEMIKRIPKGDLICIKSETGEYFNIVGVDDDCAVGLWDIRVRKEEEGNNDFFGQVVENAKRWKKWGLKAEIHWN